MALNLTTADAALKENYLPAIRNQLNNEIPTLTVIEPRKQELEGRRTVLSLQVGRNAGIGARLDGGTLPTAGNQQYAEERVTLRYIYGRMEVSGPAIAAMRSDRGSFVRAVDSETRGLTTDLKRDVNRQLWGTSNGVIAAVDTTAASTTLELLTTTTEVQMRHFFVGMRIDIGTVAELGAGSGGPVYGAVVTGINFAARQLVLDQAVTAAVGDFVAIAGSGGATTTQKELTGLQSIVAASGALFNVDPATYPLWASTVDANGGTPRTITEALMEGVIDDIGIESGEFPTHAFASHGVRRAYANLLMSNKRYVNTVDLKGGYKGLVLASPNGDLPIIVDRDVPSNSIFFLNVNHLWFGKGEDWGWMDEDGAVLSRVANKDAYEATLKVYAELFTDKRNAHGKLADITEA